MSSSPIQTEFPVHAATPPDGSVSKKDGKQHAYGMAKKPGTVRAYDSAAEIVAALMKSPRSVDDLSGEIGISKNSIRKYLNAFRRSGVAYQKLRPGRTLAIYALQPSLFELPDATLKATR